MNFQPPMPRAGRLARPSVGLVWLACGLVLSGGCVQRRLTIRSSPPGALVYIDDYEIGTTPCSTDYIYYGTRKFRLVADGYETLTVEQRVPPPWYQYFPLDFVSENVWPGEIRDERTLNFQLTPQRITPAGEVMGRAENLRQATRAGINAPVALPTGTGGGGSLVPGLLPGDQPGRTSPGYLDPNFIPRGHEALSPPEPVSPLPSTPNSLPAPGTVPEASGPLFVPPAAGQANPPAAYAPPPPPRASLSPRTRTAAVPASPFPDEPPGGWQPRR